MNSFKKVVLGRTSFNITSNDPYFEHRTNLNVLIKLKHPMLIIEPNRAPTCSCSSFDNRTKTPYFWIQTVEHPITNSITFKQKYPPTNHFGMKFAIIFRNISFASQFAKILTKINGFIVAKLLEYYMFYYPGTGNTFLLGYGHTTLKFLK